MANTKRKRGKVQEDARPRTETAEVSHPRLEGNTEFVSRVTDTLTSMYNRKQITMMQFCAGDRYRLSHEMTSASSGGSMDFDRARGSRGTAPISPALTFLLAAECVSEARKKLYPKDFAIVHRVCVLGLSIEGAAKQLYDARFDGAWDPYVKEAGRKFRVGLENLAEMWWPDSVASEKRRTKDKKTGEEIRPIRNIRNGKSTVTDAPAPNRNPSGVVHATKDKIYRGAPSMKRDRA